MLKKEVTIYDLAHQLKLSTATISRALNDDPVVSNKTRKTIQDLARSRVTNAIRMHATSATSGRTRSG